MIPKLEVRAERVLVAATAKTSKTVKPEVIATGPNSMGRPRTLNPSTQGPTVFDRSRYFQPDDAAGAMRHKELERWYRLKNLQKSAQVLVVVTIVVLIAGYAVSRIWRSDQDTFKIPADVQSGSKIEKFSVVVPGKNPWRLKAASATVTDDMDVVALTRPTAQYEGGKGASILLSADSGEWNRKSGNVRARGHVVIRFKDMTFSTGQITYSQKEKQAKTDSAVTMKGEGTRVTGKGFRLSIPDEEFVIKDEVEARLSDVNWASNGSTLPW